MLTYIIAAVFFLGAISMYLSGRQNQQNGVRTPAEVVGRQWVESHGPDGGGSFFPVVQFRTADGSEVRTRTRTGGAFARQSVGKQVTVIYDPASPYRYVVIDSFLGRGTLGRILCLVAGIGVIVTQLY